MAGLMRASGTFPGRCAVFACGACVLLCLVLSATAPLEGAGSSPVAEALKAHLRTAYPWPEFEIADITLNERVPDRVPSRIVLDKTPPGRVPFTVEFTDGTRINGTAVVKAYDRVVMSTRANRKGYVMRDDDVYTALMDITRIPRGALKDPAAVVGRALSRQVAGNVPVLDAMIREMPLVKRGHRVTILAETPSMSITTFGELKADSLVGSHVKVLNLQSKKIVSGVLADENTVKVDF